VTRSSGSRPLRQLADAQGHAPSGCVAPGTAVFAVLDCGSRTIWGFLFGNAAVRAVAGAGGHGRVGP
jgi:hypothetical protein